MMMVIGKRQLDIGQDACLVHQWHALQERQKDETTCMVLLLHMLR